MLVRLGVALALGALIGIEREQAGKEAGFRTSMMVSGGAAIFTIIGLELPHIVALSPEHLLEVIARNSGFLTVIANIVVGIGFLGAGVIIKTGEHVRGLTTAAVMWVAAAIGTLAGVGLIEFATISAASISLILYITRKLGLSEKLLKERWDKGQ
jgi:putative Mg2+ transporter-C (MgtC) family protein